jgi:hypothetical protein
MGRRIKMAQVQLQDQKRSQVQLGNEAESERDMKSVRPVDC